MPETLDEFRVMDAAGRVVVLSEKMSSIFVVLAIISFLISLLIFVVAYLFASENLAIAAIFGLAGISVLLHIPVFLDISYKGDMNVDRAVFQAVDGRTIEVWKEKSLWATLALAISIAVLAASLGLIGAGFVLTALGKPLAIALALPGIPGLVAGIIGVKIYRFLRTKINFPGETITIKTRSNDLVKLYKITSIWAKIGMILSTVTAIGMLALAALLGTRNLGALERFEALDLESTVGIAMFAAAGLFLLINAAVLNFLRTRGHIVHIQS